MRSLILFVLLFVFLPARADDPAPFEIREGDRVVLLGDALLERENTYGYLETRMHEQFPDRRFIVRNLSWAGDTPRGWSRASFDPPEKGYERLKEAIALVKPTVVFLGYGMAASLQEMTDRAQDITLNRDEARYGSEPMSAARFKKELGALMDAIVETGNRKPETGKNPDSAPPENLSGLRSPVSALRFVLLSPIRHEDLRAVRPGLPDPAPHNALLEQYSKAIEELAKEKGARFVDLFAGTKVKHRWDPAEMTDVAMGLPDSGEFSTLTDDGIHLTKRGFEYLARESGRRLAWDEPIFRSYSDALRETAARLGAEDKLGGVDGPRTPEEGALWKAQAAERRVHEQRFRDLRAAVLKKNDLFFHRFRPENATYLFGFRKHEQGQNAVEIPKFDPLIEAADAEIDKIKRTRNAESGDRKAAALVERKLQQIIIPRLEFKDATIREAVDFLKRRSVELDPDELKGIGIVLKLDAGRGGLVPPPPVPEIPIPGLPVAPPAATPGSPEPAWEEPRITLKLSNAPLLDAFKRVAELAKLKFAIEPDGRVSLTAAPPATPVPAGVTPPPLPNFTVADGYQIDLWAQNPLLEKPTQMNWDALGRLWVCSSSLYPQIEPGQAANDKILILEDTDRDGKADKSSVFADGLLIPTAVVPDLGFRNYDLGFGKNAAAPAGNEKSAPREAPGSQILNPKSEILNSCYVGQSTELLHFTDTDGDGKADTRRVVFSGFGTEDTHHLIHTLKWGPDGRLYWNQSIYIHSHLETPWGMVRLNSGGIFAYDPRTERVEVYAKGWCNPWGHAWDQWGQSFTTDGAGGQGVSWVIPGAMYFTYENARRIAPSISPGNYPKFCSLELIHSPMFPDDWQGNAVTNDFRAHRVVRFEIEDLSESGNRKAETGKNPDNVPKENLSALRSPLSGFTTKEMPDLVRTNDQSFRPIDIRLGPDGALYVADWSNPVINHGEVDFRDPRRDHHMGRIWRISKKDTPPVKWEPLAGKKNMELVFCGQSQNAWESSEARRVLAARLVANPAEMSAVKGALAGGQIGADFRGAFDWDSYLTEIAFSKHPGPGAGSADPRARAIQMRINGAVGALSLAAFFTAGVDADIRKSLPAGERFEDLSPARLEEWRMVSRRTYEGMFDGYKNRARDDSPRVRVETMRILSRIPTAESAALVLEAAMKSPGESGAINARGEEKGGQFDKPTFSDTKDPYYGYAAWLSINDLAKPWTDAIASGAWKADTAERQQQLAWGLRAIDPALAGATISRLFSENKIPLDGTGPWIELLGQAGGAKEIRGLLDKLAAAQLPPDAEPRALAALADAARLRNLKPEGDLKTAAVKLSGRTGVPPGASNPAHAAAALRLLGLWKLEETVINSAAAMDAKTPAELRFASIDALRSIGSPSSMNLLETLTRPDQDVNIRRAALVAITQVKLDAGVVKAADVLPAITDENAALETWRALLAVKGAPDAFAVKLPRDLPKPVATAGIRAAREAGKSGAKLLAALTPLAGISEAAAKMPGDFKALAAQAKQNGDPARGELIYRRAALTCTVCHAIGGAGGKVGPDMTSLGASAPLDYIIESTLNPTVKVKEGYNAVTLTLKDGTQATGVQARETPQEFFLRDATGREQAVPKAQIASTTNIGSLMPAGLTDQLQDRERLDLYAFLGELGKPGPFDASKGNVARVWRLFSGNDVEKVVKGDAALETALPGYTLVDGRFVKELLEAAAPIAANGAPTMLAVAQFQSSGGKTRLTLTGAEKVWLDGQPLAIVGELAPELSGGMHTLVVKLDVKQLPPFLRAESPDARFLGN